MLLLEHDAKMLLARAGVPIPAGELVTDPEAAITLPGPWMVKAQVTAGGRGKAGGVRPAWTETELRESLRAMIGMSLKGHRVRACRVERQASGAEAYLAVMADPVQAGVRLLVSARGGIDVEARGRSEGGLLTTVVAPDRAAAASGFGDLCGELPRAQAGPVVDAAERLVDAFFRYEATLLEINPLFIGGDGAWCAGDAKMILDPDAAPRCPEIAALVRGRADAYPEAFLKLDSGFDYAEIDHTGGIGMLTTGAGLSMMLMDELSARGLRPFNFCDIRTGQLRGDPRRLIEVLGWIGGGPNVRVVLVNVFAGITDLGEFARLLVEALRAVPALRVPVVARIIGNGYDDAYAAIRAAPDLPIRIEPDLERALAAVAQAAVAQAAGA